MNGRLVWRILRKDLRRLWWMIVLTIALLCRLVHFDSLRNTAVPGSEEGWLNILLPLAWSVLIALALMEDPVIGEAPFWKTVPFRWQSLVAAKALFAFWAVHVPYFIGCAAILHARGFAPGAYLPELMRQQLTLLAVTLSSFALATVVRTVTQFVMIAAVLITAVAASPLHTAAPGQSLRIALVFLVAGIAGLWISLLQYGRTRTPAARTIAAAAGVITALVWWLPPEAFYGLDAAVSPAPVGAGFLSIRRAGPEDVSGCGGYSLFDAVPLGIPVRVNGLASGSHARLVQQNLTLEARNGNSYRAKPRRSPGESERLFASLCGPELPTGQMLAVDRKLFNAIGNNSVTLQGRALAAYYKLQAPVRMTVGENIPVANAGRCASEIRMNGDNPNDEQLHVDCESPGALPRIRIALTDRATGRTWDAVAGVQQFGASPQGVWLSPVNRRDAYFLSTDEEHYKTFGGKRLVPRDVIGSVEVAITPELSEGSRTVSYEIPNIRLGDYLVKP